MRRTSFLKLSVIVAVLLALLGSTLVLVSENKRLKVQLRQSDELFQKMQKEASRLETEKSQIAREYETLQNETVSYVALNTKLQEETDQLHARVTEAEGTLKDKEGELQRVQGQLEKLHKEMARLKTEKRQALTKEFNDLTRKVATLSEDLKHERSLYQYNLGVVYAQAQRYDDAIAAYQKSLEFNPKNADAHYNLGLLYERVKGQSDKAAWHYRRYLEHNPQAEDRDEVQHWVDMLTAAVK